MTKTLQFTTGAATVKAALLGMSVNAPSMAIVVPGSVQNSFVAYKISGTTGLSWLRHRRSVWPAPPSTRRPPAARRCPATG